MKMTIEFLNPNQRQLHRPFRNERSRRGGRVARLVDWKASRCCCGRIVI